MYTKLPIMIAGLILSVGAVAQAHDFTWDNLMLASAKLQPDFDYESRVDSYMQIYRPEVWQRYHNDEFELQDKRLDTVAMMREKIADFPLDETFTLNTSFRFGDYDFGGQMFPVNALSKQSYFSTRARHGSYGFPYVYRVFFVNPEMISNLAMPKAEARAFLKERKSSYGSVDRSLPTTIEFRVVGLRRAPDQLNAKIIDAKFYKSDKRQTALADFK